MYYSLFLLDNKHMNKAKLSLITSMVIFGTVAIFRRNLDMSSSMISMLRGIIGATFLVIVTLSNKEQLIKPANLKELVLIILAGALLGINWILLFESYRYTSLATATLCYYMAPIFVIIFSLIFLKEKLTRTQIITMTIALLGITLVSGVFDGGKIEGLKGILFGLGAAVCYGLVVVTNRMTGNASATYKTIVQLSTTAIILLPYNFINHEFDHLILSSSNLILILILGILHTGIAYTIYFNAIKDVDGQSLAIYSYIDPIVTIILSTCLLHEAMSIYEIIGMILVLGATLYGELKAN